MVDLKWFDNGASSTARHEPYYTAAVTQVWTTQGRKFDVYVYRQGSSVSPYGGIRRLDTQEYAEQIAAQTIEADLKARGEIEPAKTETPIERCLIEPELGVTVGAGSLLWRQFGAIHVALARKSADEPIVTFEVAPVACDPRGSAWCACCYAETDDRPKLDQDSYEAVNVETAKLICQKTWDAFCRRETFSLETHSWIEVAKDVYETRYYNRSAVLWNEPSAFVWNAVITLASTVRFEAFLHPCSAECAKSLVDKILDSDLKSVATPA